MSRYVTRRVNGSWQVQDSLFHDFIMGEYGAGSTGYKQARAVADGLNEQPPPGGRPTLTPTSTVNDLVIPNNDLRSSSGLRNWRRAHKLSQQKLANVLEVHVQSVSRWETGEIPIPRTVELALLYLDQTLSAQPTSAAAV